MMLCLGEYKAAVFAISVKTIVLTSSFKDLHVPNK